MTSTTRRYVRRPDAPVVAVRLDLDTDGLVYRKWGGVQRAKPGDWRGNRGEREAPAVDELPQVRPRPSPPMPRT